MKNLGKKISDTAKTIAGIPIVVVWVLGLGLVNLSNKFGRKNKNV